MDTLAIIKRIEIRLTELGMNKSDFYKKSGISSASFSQWKTGIYNPTKRKLESAAACLNVSYEYLVHGSETEKEPMTTPKNEDIKKTPVLTNKDERDIGKKLNGILTDLENPDGFMFMGEPIDDTTRELLATSLRNSLEIGKTLAKQKYTPKKYLHEEECP